jgi:thiamine biosynthesis protein ThiI
MESVVIVRYSEIAVKGPSTRARMESLLARNLLDALRSLGASGDVRVSEGRIFIWRPSPDAKRAAVIASKVFGVKSASPAVSFQFRGLDDLVERAAEWFGERVRGKVFRVRARRVGSHDFHSKDVERLLGSLLLELGAAGVDLENPEYTAYVEIRGHTSFLYDEIVEGPGGLPLGSEDRVLVLFSGGFDSTAAAWMAMKRGSPVALAYYDLGHTEALRVAVEVGVGLANSWAFGGDIEFIHVHFHNVAREVHRRVRPEYRALIIRRLMLEHASLLAEDLGFEALVTGDNVGQVATQTVRNLRLLGANLPRPVIRPVAGMDKDEIVSVVRRIGLYDSSSRQVEVCRMAPTPTPRGDPAVFASELGRVRDLLQGVEYNTISLRGKKASEAFSELLGR